MKTIYKKLLFFLLLLPFGVLAQNALSGVVLDKKSNQPLPGVNVVVQGANQSTTTDFDGKFELRSLKNGDKIVFSFIGYESATVTYSGQKMLSITLDESANQLQEVVVQVGYGSVKKKDATGSVAVLTSKDFNKGAIVSADQLLAGKVAGVRITTNGGDPDSAPNIRIRGGASINASNNPLIVIDGIPIDSNNPAGVNNPLSLINPNDIESFSVLKDASATAIYGSRASNGVIIITTKKGTSGEIKFNYSANFSAGRIGKTINMMDSATFVKFIEEYFPNKTNLLGVDDPNSTLTDDLSTPGIIEGRILSNTNWQDAIVQNTFSTDHNFSARAAIFKNIPFRASLGYNQTEGLIKTSDYKRLTLSLKLSPMAWNDHLKMDFNIKGISTRKNDIDAGGALGNALVMDPTKPVYDNSSSNRFGGYYQNLIFDQSTNRMLLDGAWNPLALLEQRTRPVRVYRFLGNAEFDYKVHFLPELHFVNNLAMDASRAVISENFTDNSIATYRFNQSTDPNANYVFNPGRNNYEAQRITNTTWDSYFLYTKNLNGFVNKFDVQAGYSYQNFKNDGHKDLYTYNTVTGVRELVINDNRNNRYYNLLNLQSFFGRANIDFAKKYLLTLSLRADGSSLFLKDKRWGYFPSAALAWKVKEENFLKNVGSVNDLKIRLGVGKTGQQNITDFVGFYPSTPLFTVGSSSSQYLGGANLYSAGAFDPNLTWEKTTTYNIGIDFDLFKNSLISGSLDVYNKKTTDLLAKITLPPGQGLSDSFIKNVGSTDGKGVELGLNIKPIQSDNSNLSFNANLAYNYTKVTDLKGQAYITAQESSTGVETGTYLAVHQVGQQAYSAWVYQQVYDTNGNPIQGAYVDRNGDGQINDNDRYFKALRPNWTFGFGFTYNYKNWDLSSSFRGQFGGQVYNRNKVALGYLSSAIPANSNSLQNVLDFYSGAANPAFETKNGNIIYSDYFLEDATFIRCENIVLGYRFPKLTKTASLRLYGSINNAFIITKYSGRDPENFNAIDNNFYPRPKMYTFGLSLDF